MGHNNLADSRIRQQIVIKIIIKSKYFLNMEEKDMKKKVLAVLLATGVAAITLFGGSILVSEADEVETLHRPVLWMRSKKMEQSRSVYSATRTHSDM